MTKNNIFELKNISKVFKDGTQALKDVSLEIKQGVTTIIGPSGSGKSTMLRMLNLLEIPTTGDLYYLQQPMLDKAFNLKLHRQKVNMVFQNFNLFSHLTVMDNLNLAQIEVLNKSKHDATNTSNHFLELVGLSDKAQSYPNQLSGGQKQRVAIARSLCMEPNVILFDEPTSALDPEMIKEVLLVMRKLVSDGMTMIIVTHEMNFAKAFANHVIVVDQGQVVEQGTPDYIFSKTTNARVKQFLDNMDISIK